MELVFLYIKKYGNIIEKCFNLNPKCILRSGTATFAELIGHGAKRERPV